MENIHTELRKRRRRKYAAKIAAALFAAALLAGLFVITAPEVISKETNTTMTTTATTTQGEWLLTHAERTWIAALEWCESRGNPRAINPKDKDGTPSFGAFQFKPETLEWYGQKYKIIATDTPITEEIYMDRDIQVVIVEHMLRDKTVRWQQQFPDCTIRKIGPPPQQLRAD